jgi:uncharacterized short protein YbdD (DUF466 family)
MAVRASSADGNESGTPEDARPRAFSAAGVRILIRDFWRKAVQIGRLIIGVPDYDTYVEHLRRFHPERTPMSYEEFFVERQTARYKGGGGRCC